MEFLYRDSTGDFIRTEFEDTSDSTFSWGHLSKNSQAIALAARALKDIPVEQYSKETGPTGQYLNLEWSREIDWFRPSMPWRCNIPGLSADNPDKWFNEFATTAWGLAWIEMDNRRGYVFNERWRRNCIDDLAAIARCCAAIRGDGIYPQGNPIPTSFTDDTTDTVYPSLHEAEEEATKLKRHMLDGIAFVWWFTETFSNWRHGLTTEVVAEIQHWTEGLNVKRGFLLDLSRDWESIDLVQLLSHDVPIVYAWSPAEARDPRFQRLSPEFLQSYWHYIDSVPGGQEGYLAVPALSDQFPAVVDYDAFLQNGMNGFYDDGFCPGPEWDTYRVFVCDFEGWQRREITNVDVKKALRIRYFARTLWVDNERVILYWRFRPRPASAHSIYMDVEGAIEPIHEVRAMYQFRYAPHSGRSYDKERGELTLPRPITTPSHPHVTRYSGEYVPPVRGRRLPVYSTNTSPSPRPRESRRHSPYPTSPERHSTGGRLPSLASRLSDAPADAVQLPSLATCLTSPPRSHHSMSPPAHERTFSATESDLFHNTEPDWQAVSEADWRRSAQTWSRPMFPDSPEVPMGNACVWNPIILEHGVLQVRSREADVRLRLHAVLTDRRISIEDLLTWAISRGLRFAIGYPDAELPRFLPALVTEGDYSWGNLYNGITTDPELVWSKGASDFIDKWRAAATTVLLRPHARAVVFRGGPLSWISRLFRGDELIADVMMGPSVQVTIHRRGELDARHAGTLWYDRISATECNVLYGFVAGEKNKPDTDRTLWPTEAQLWESLPGYSGIWSDLCERIYGGVWSKIEQGFAEPLTKGGWNQVLRNKRFNEPAGPRPAGADWQRADQEIDLHFPLAKDWNGKALADITLPLEFQM